VGLKGIVVIRKRRKLKGVHSDKIEEKDKDVSSNSDCSNPCIILSSAAKRGKRGVRSENNTTDEV
jgi:hypothetical protein